MSEPSSRTSKRVEDPRRLVVSFHDLHPGSREACARFLGLLRERGIERISLLVVPRWHGGAPFTEDAAFTSWLRARADEGHDICLHGFFHRAEAVGGGLVRRLIGRHYTNGEGEFFQIGRDMARDRLRRGLDILAGTAGLPVYGFTPPAWLLSGEGRAALVETGLHYTTSLARVDLLRRGRSLRAPTIVYSCRSAWRRVVSRAWVRVWAWLNAGAIVLRVAAHPGDFVHPKVEASLWRQIERALAAGRRPATYRDLLAPDVAPVATDPLAAA